MALPPLLEGALHERLTCPSPGEAEKLSGAEGVVAGVAFTAGLEAGPVPAAFVAATTTAYETPLVSPVKIMGLEEPDTTTAADPSDGVAVTVYEVIALPPFEDGGAKVTVNWESPAVTATLCGADGVVIGVEAIVAEGPEPTALTALTAKAYEVPSVRPVTV